MGYGAYSGRSAGLDLPENRKYAEGKVLLNYQLSIVNYPFLL